MVYVKSNCNHLRNFSVCYYRGKRLTGKGKKTKKDRRRFTSPARSHTRTHECCIHSFLRSLSPTDVMPLIASPYVCQKFQQCRNRKHQRLFKSSIPTETSTVSVRCVNCSSWKRACSLPCEQLLFSSVQSDRKVPRLSQNVDVSIKLCREFIRAKGLFLVHIFEKFELVMLAVAFWKEFHIHCGEFSLAHP